MARLIVRYQGQEIHNLTLDSGQEYLAGRSSDVQLHLPNARGISRHHLKFFERDGKWMCETLSKYIPMQKGSETFEILELTESCTFTLTPFEFAFEADIELPAADPTPDDLPNDNPAPPPKPNLPTFYQPRPHTHASSQMADRTNEDTQAVANNEATMAGVGSSLVPYLRISYPNNTADDEVLKLEGHLWVAGRDPTAEIPIESPHVSRKHFELARTNEGFYITDLGSSNGSKLNGQRLPPHEPTKVESGDEISIKNVRMMFEIRDAQFNHRIENLPVPTLAPLVDMNSGDYGMGAALQPYAPAALGPAPRDLPEDIDPNVKIRERKKLIFRVGIGVLAVIVLGVAFSGPTPKPTTNSDGTPANNQNGATSVSFDKLSTEQRSVVKDSFNLARSLYVQGKYELCLTELAKLHELIPLYENSKELQSFCEQGRELVRRQRDADLKAHEAAQIEQKISDFVEDCKSKLNDKSTVDETRQCLAEAIELSPEHHLIVEMIHSAQMHEQEQKFLEGQRRAENAKAKQGADHFAKAKSMYKSGQLYKALNEYQKLLNTPYPQSAGLKESAKRDIASIKQELQAKVGTLLEQCKSLGSKGQYKDAYQACKQAGTEAPDNDEAKRLLSQMTLELRREMKTVYEDSVLEESLGNVDSAKEKWRKIIKEDLSDGDYANKARVKLKKYEGPM